MPDLRKIILGSGFCADSAAFLRFYLSLLRLPAVGQLFLLLRVKFSPRIFDAVRAADLPILEKSALFSAAMNLFRSGPSYKTTFAGRSPLTDAAITARLKPGMLVVEAGVSDGISAAGLLERAGGAEIMLTDRNAFFLYRDYGPVTVFYNGPEDCLAFKFLCFYFCTGLRAGEPPADCGRVSLLNPVICENSAVKELVPFDIFTGKLPRKADIIKCANVLNAVYFSQDEIKRALLNLAENLAEGGWLLLSHNHPRYAQGEAYLALRREGRGLALLEERNGHELLAGLRSPLFSGLVKIPGEPR